MVNTAYKCVTGRVRPRKRYFYGGYTLDRARQVAHDLENKGVQDVRLEALRKEGWK